MNQKEIPIIFILLTAFVGLLLTAPSTRAALGGPESVAKNSRYQQTIGIRGMVVSDDAEASEWGAKILRQGGNAVDAAVATAFAMSVTRPHYASLGGGGFLVFCPKPVKAQTPGVQSLVPPCQTLDFREKAPAAATRDMYIRNGKVNEELAEDGALASGVPGNPAGLLTALEKLGTLKRSQVLSYPIQIAEKGFRFSTHAEVAASSRWEAMNAEAKRIFGCMIISTTVVPGTPTKKELLPCSPGTLVRQPDLARVLKALAKTGARGFYEGPVAKTIVAEMKKAGGILTEQDFKSYQPRFRDPIVGSFDGYQVISMAPPSSGGIILEQLLGYAVRAKKMELFKDGPGSTLTLHALAHAMGLAYRDRAIFLGDPDSVALPDFLLKSAYLDQQWQSFKHDEAAIPKVDAARPVFSEFKGEKHQETTHLSVMDADGNAVAMTLTVNDNFGSGFVPKGSGIVMNNQMDDFSLQAGVPNMFGLVGTEANAVGPGKRPLSSMTPTILRDGAGQPRIVIGAAGGPRIISAVFQTLINRIIFKMSLADALFAPRIHEQWVPQNLLIEKFGAPFEVRTALQKKGYTLEEVQTLGKGHAVERLDTGRTSGVADPRGEGRPVAE